MVISLLHSLLPCPALARRALRLHVAAANYGVDSKVRHDSETRSIACLFSFPLFLFLFSFLPDTFQFAGYQQGAVSCTYLGSGGRRDGIRIFSRPPRADDSGLMSSREVVDSVPRGVFLFAEASRCHALVCPVRGTAGHPPVLRRDPVLSHPSPPRVSASD
ncbi:hypothetical protein BDW72DRAFT_81559 [Aspergillus terricola var. indicus]